MEQRGVRSVRSSVGSVRDKLENVVVVRSRLRAETSAGNRCRGHRILSPKTRTRPFENIDVAHLWIHDEVRSNKLKLRKTQERGKRGRSGHQSTQLVSDHEALPNVGVCLQGRRNRFRCATGRGDVLGLRFTARQGKRQRCKSKCS